MSRRAVESLPVAPLALSTRSASTDPGLDQREILPSLLARADLDSWRADLQEGEIRGLGTWGGPGAQPAKMAHEIRSASGLTRALKDLRGLGNALSETGDGKVSI